MPSNAPGNSGSTELPVTSATLDAKILIVSADGTEPVLGAIRQAADYEGIPYTLYIANRTPGGFTPSTLSDGDRHAFYQGIVLTTGTLAYNNGGTWTSAFNTSEWQTLWDYQAKYRVRTAIAYAFPTADLGYGPATGVDATTTPISASLTSTGRTMFSYVNAANPIVITRAWTYLAPAAGTGTNVLLNDPQQHALALVKTYPDGRQVLSTTFDGNFFLIHSLALSHGVMNWVTEDCSWENATSTWRRRSTTSSSTTTSTGWDLPHQRGRLGSSRRLANSETSAIPDVGPASPHGVQRRGHDRDLQP